MALDPIQIILQASDQTADGLSAIAKGVEKLTQDIQTKLNTAFTGSKFGAALLSDIEGSATKLPGVFGRLATQIGTQLSNIKLPGGDIFGKLAGAATSLAEGPIGAVSFAFNNVTESIGKLKEFGTKVFEGLIAQVVEVRQQTLGIAANISAQQQVSIGGVKIEDPTKAIQALLPEVQAGIKQLQKDSLDTTSTTAQLVPIYQTITGQLNSLNISTAQAEKLTIRLSQAAGGLNLPYQQAQQEIAGIARGEINSYNQLGKALGLNNEVLRSLIAQGRVYEFLEQKTAGLAAGQKLQAEQLPGLLSSITDAVELITQATGAPILDAIVPIVKTVLAFLKENQEEFETIGRSVSEFFVAVGSKLGEAVAVIAQALTPLLEVFKQNATQGAEAFANTIKTLADIVLVLAQAIAPVVGLLAEFVKIISDLASSDLGRLVEQAGLLAFIAIPLASSLTAAGAAITAFGAGIPAIVAGLTALTPLLVASLPELALLAGGALLAAAPFIALAAAAGLVVAGIESIKVGKTNEAIEALSNSTNVLADESLSYASKLKVLSDAEKSNGKLTEEQLAQRRQLLALSAGTRQSLEQQIADLKRLQPANQEQANALKVQITLLEERQKLLAGQSAPTLGNKALIEIGDTTKQIRTALASAQQDLLNPDKAEDAAKRLIKASQEAVENGTITREQAAANLQALATNKGLLLDTQLSAQKAITKLKQDAGKEELDQLKLNETQIQDAIKAGNLSQIEGEQQLTAAKAAEVAKQIDVTEKALQREDAEKRGQGPVATGLRRQLQEQQAQLGAVQEDGLKKRAAVATASFDNEQKLLDAKVKEGLIGEQAAADQSLDITKRRATAELAELERQKAKLDPKDTVGRAAIEVREEALKSAVEEGIRKRASVVSQGFENEQKILEGNKAQGLVTESQFADQSLALTQKRLAIELKELERQKSLLAKADTAGLEALNAKEAEIRKKGVDAVATFEQQKVAILERSQKQTEDAIKLSQVNQETQIQQLLNQRSIRQVEAEALRVQAKQKVDAQELELEKQKTAALEALPKLSDPEKEAARQERIRASRIKTAELTGQLAKDEYDRQQSAFKLITDRLDRQAQAAKNAVEAQVQPLQNELQLQDVLTKSLENQNKLIEARKGLQDSLTGYIQGELGILAQTAKSERDKKNIAELTAAIKLRSLQQQQAIERQVLELNLLQEQAALRKEKIQNRIAQLQNIADQAQARADVAKTAADPNATPEQREAAQANLRAKQGAGVGLQLQGALLDQQGQQQEQLAGFKRQTLNNTQALQDDEARAALIQTLPKGSQNEALNNLQRDTLAKLGLSVDSLAQLTPITERIDFAARQRGGVGGFNLPGVLNPVARGAEVQQSPAVDRLAQQLETLSKGGAIAALPALDRATATLPPVPGRNTAATAAGVRSGGKDGAAVAAGGVVINMQNAITNNFENGDVQNGALARATEQAVLGALFNVATIARNQKGSQATK